MDFKLHSQFRPTGDQPQAIEALTRGLNMGLSDQVLLGVTGSGKTFTMANIIANVNRPTLVLAHNKTLAAQLCSEFREFFPENAVEYFVSYYDYYQPEAYIAQTDTYIEKDSAINDEIEQPAPQRDERPVGAAGRDRRLVASRASTASATRSTTKTWSSRCGPAWRYDRDELMRKLVDIQLRAQRHQLRPQQAYRVRGDTLEVFPAYSGGPGHPHRIFRRRDRPHLRDQRRHRRAGAHSEPRRHLPRVALRGLEGENGPRHEGH